MNRFVIGSPLIRDNAISAILDLPMDYSHEVVIRKAKSKRSNSQNNLMWMWEKDIADETGVLLVSEEQKKQWHEDILISIYGQKQIESKNPITGKVSYRTVAAKRTSEFSVKEMVEHLTLMEITAVNMGWKLRYPDDYKYAMTGKR